LSQLPGLKVGLVWAGNPYKHHDDAAAMNRRRSMAFAELAPLLLVPGCSFVSLQVGAAASQRRAPVYALPRPLTDFADTADLIMGLDLVIAVDTSVVHLAGALGAPVWLLNRWDTCWRWLLHRADNPWYPTLRIFRQHEPGDWRSVVSDVARELAQQARDFRQLT
jgi:hypothetical protein